MLDIILLIAALLIAIPAIVLAIECFAALLGPSKSDRDSKMIEPRAAVDLLIPAHNEASDLAGVLAGYASQLRPNDRMLVVADNCIDATAAVARASGARALERTDALHRGKGYALAAGAAALARGDFGPPNPVLIVLDADCQLAPRAIDALAHAATNTGRPIQAAYLMHAAGSGANSPRALISELAVTVKNRVRLLGLARLGVPCLLTGSGMAFPAAVLARVNLSSGDIVEDMKLGVDLLLAGHPPLYCDAAQVFSALPVDSSAANSQRTRWEHGHLHTSLTQIPRLILSGVRTFRWRMFAAALDFCIPPLSLLVLVWLAVAIATVAAALFGHSPLPAIIALACGMTAALALVFVIVRFRRREIPLSALAGVPWYVAAKVPRFLAFALRRRQRAWVRTPRATEVTTNPAAAQTDGATVHH